MVPVVGSICPAAPTPTARIRSPAAVADASRTLATMSAITAEGSACGPVEPRPVAAMFPSLSTRAVATFVPPRSTPTVKAESIALS